MLNDKRGILYVGKAKNIRKRLQQYFSSGRDRDLKTRTLITHVARIDYIVTKSEIEALILENSLIKQHKPKYNVLLKDGKEFPFLRINQSHPYPRLEIVRKLADDGAYYFGPFLQIGGVGEMVKAINNLFRLRRCSDRTFSTVKRPCLLYQIKKCDAPCVKSDLAEEYKIIVKSVILFLQGHTGRLTRELETEMTQAAEGLNFEQAARLRDQLQRIKRMKATQHITNVALVDQDVFVVHQELGQIFICVIQVRDKRVCHMTNDWVAGRGENETELVGNLLAQFYWHHPPPKLITCNVAVDHSLFKSYFQDKYGKPVLIRKPQIAAQHELVALADHNIAERKQAFSANAEKSVLLGQQLKKMFRLLEIPRRIECYDISTIQGSFTVGAYAVSLDGQINQSCYRRFKIDPLIGQNDFACIQYVLNRRFTSQRQLDWPDLIVIDGGKGQLTSGLEAMKALDIHKIKVIALAKSRGLTGLEGSQRRSSERVFLPQRKDPLILSPGSLVFNHLTLLRDESHRFAIGYHRKLREKKIHLHQLSEVQGVGEILKQKLLIHFGSLKVMRTASVEELCLVRGISQQLAVRIKSAIALKTLILGVALWTLLFNQPGFAQGKIHNSVLKPIHQLPLALSRQTVKYTTLFNGIKVILMPDARIDGVILQASYLFGSQQDPAPQFGVSNVIRHLPVLRKKYNKLNEVDIRRSVFDLGGSFESTITGNSIDFVYRIPASSYAEILAIEAHRVTNRSLSKENWVRSKILALRDIHQTQGDASPEAETDEVLNLFFKSVKGFTKLTQPLYGTNRSIVDLKYAEVEKFYDQYFIAESLLIAATGNFSPEKMLKDIVALFSSVRRASVKRIQPGGLALSKLKIKSGNKLYRANGPEQLLGICPIFFPARSVKMQVKSVVGLIEKMQLDESVIQFDEIALREGDVNYVYFKRNLSPQHGFNTVRAQIESFISKLPTLAIGDSSLAIVKRRLLYQLLQQNRDGRAQLSYLVDQFKLDGFVQRHSVLVDLNQIHAKELLTVMKRVLNLSTCIFSHVTSEKPVLIQPSEEKIKTQETDAPPGTPGKLTTLPVIQPSYFEALTQVQSQYSRLKERNDFWINRSEILNQEEIQSPPQDIHYLSNRLKLVYIPNAQKKTVAISFFIGVKPIYVSPKKAGLFPLLGLGLPLATKEFAVAELKKQLFFLGAGLSISSNRVFVDVFREDLDDVLRIIAEILMRPTFPPKQVDTIKMAHAEKLAKKKEQRRYQVERYFEETLYFAHRLSVPDEGTVESVTGLQPVDFINFHKKYFLPNNCKLYVTGNITFAETKSLVAKYFKQWKPSFIATPLHKAPPPSTARFIDVLEREKPSLDVYIGHLALIPVKKDIKDYAHGIAFQAIFNSFNHESSRLNAIRRDEAFNSAMTITGSAPFYGAADPNKFFVEIKEIPEDSLDSVLYQLVLMLSKLKTQGAGKSELTAVTNHFIRTIFSSYGSSEQLLNNLFLIDELGFSQKDIVQALRKLTPASFAAFVKQKINLDILTIIIDGKLLRRKPYLSKLKDVTIRLR